MNKTQASLAIVPLSSPFYSFILIQNIMKKLLTLVAALVVSGAALAQNGIGVNALYNTKAEVFGLGIKGQHLFTSNLRGEAEFDLYFPEVGSMLGGQLNLQYLLPLAPGANAYPLVGVGYLNTKVGDYSTGSFMGNIGAGVEYNITHNLKFNFEAKYQVGKKAFSTGLLNAGLIYQF